MKLTEEAIEIESLRRECDNYKRLYEDQKNYSSKALRSGLGNEGENLRELEEKVSFLNQELSKRKVGGGGGVGQEQVSSKALEEELDMYRNREQEYHSQKARLNDVLFQFVMVSAEIESLKHRN